MVGLALVVGGAALGASRQLWAGPTGLAAVGLVVGLVVFNGPCDYETAYHCAEVVEDPARDGGRTLVLDGVRNSYVDLDDPTYLEFRYARVMADVIAVATPPGPLDVLSIGGGGFTFPAYLDAVRPGTGHTVLEIDAALVEIGREDLGLGDYATVVVDDARRSLRDVPVRSVDLVIGDAFSGLSVPWHLTTIEFVQAVADRMREGGVYLINVIDYGDLDFVRSEAATFDAVFEYGAAIAPPDYLAREAGGNFVLVGSDRPIDFDALRQSIEERSGVEEVTGDLAAFAGGAPLLRDDFAPVDQMLGRP